MIKLKIKDKEYTIQEARELYNEIKALFGEDAPGLPYPPVDVPWVQPYPAIPLNPYYTISTIGEGGWFSLLTAESAWDVQ